MYITALNRSISSLPLNQFSSQKNICKFEADDSVSETTFYIEKADGKISVKEIVETKQYPEKFEKEYFFSVAPTTSYILVRYTTTRNFQVFDKFVLYTDLSEKEVDRKISKI